MSTSPSTRISLLLRIRNPGDRIAWSQFVELYAPLIHRYGIRHGLQDADAADLAQETLRCVARSAGSFAYDPARGSFRGWLLTTTRNELRKLVARAARQPAGTGDSDVKSLLDQQPDDADEEERWRQEYRRTLFQWAARRIQPDFRTATWEAFWRTAVIGQDVEQVAKELGLTPGAVYVARSRVTARIRQEIENVEGE